MLKELFYVTPPTTRLDVNRLELSMLMATTYVNTTKTIQNPKNM